MKITNRFIVALFLLSATSFALAEPTTSTLKTRNVILVFADGIRWQDVFRGPDTNLMVPAQGVTNPKGLISHYDLPTTEARRAKLMPFFWSHVPENGIIFGNRDKGSHARVTNGMWFSYPGYSETIVGYPDDKNINSNRAIPNANVSVFEWLNQQPDMSGKVAAFGNWDVISAIFNSTRCGFPVDNGETPFQPASVELTPNMKLINDIRAVSTHDSGGYDILTFAMFSEYMKTYKPRALWLNLSETDNWGHAAAYGQYLKGITRLDNFLKTLNDMVQSMPEYKDNTTIILTVDHGRGDVAQSLEAWNSHGKKIEGSDQIFMAVWGPDTPATGEVEGGEEVTQSQVAATVAALLGYDYNAYQPRAGQPIDRALAGQEK